MLTAVFTDGQTVSAKFTIVSPQASSSSSETESTGTATINTVTDNVVTCQMAGYPADYNWNEEAKACQQGYIDENGVFHSTANTLNRRQVNVPNTADMGHSDSGVSRLAGLMIAAVIAFLLKKH